MITTPPDEGTGQIRYIGFTRHKSPAIHLTKIDGRDKNTATQQIEESLRRLETDHIDLRGEWSRGTGSWMRRRQLHYRRLLG